MKKIMKAIIVMLLALTSIITLPQETKAQEADTYGVVRTYTVNKTSSKYIFTHNNGYDITFNILITGTYTANGNEVISADLDTDFYSKDSEDSLLDAEIVSSTVSYGYAVLKINVKVRFLYGGSSLGTTTYTIQIV